MIYMICEKCGKEFPSSVVIDGITRNLKSRKHCLDCVPFGSTNGGRKILTPERINKCLYCGKPLSLKQRSFCSFKCHRDYDYKQYILQWKNGEVSGTKGEAFIDVSNYVKRYLFEKYNSKCARCGWSQVNPYTNTIPLEVEHIDGDALNNKEENLIILCPNCHSLTKTYRGANRGKSTRNIKWVSRSGTTNFKPNS